MKSVWQDNIRTEKFPKVSENLKTGVLIIGGGMCGVLCAYLLKRAGIECVLAEAKRLGSGITGHTTAKLTVQHGLIYDRITREYSREKAEEYLKVNLRALAEFRRLCSRTDCDFEEADSFVYSTLGTEKLEREREAYRSLGVDAEILREVPLPFHIAGALKLRGQAQFHPLRFIAEISRELPVYEHTFIKSVKENEAVTDDGYVIEADKIIIAAHFPFINTKGAYFLKLYQHRSYVLGLKGVKVPDGVFVDADKNGYSFRGYKDMLLLGGGAHRTGKKGGGFAELEEFAARHYKNAVICRRWATQDCMSLDGVPYIGRYSKNTPDLFVASGFNKWGMTTSMAAALILSDMIQNGTENESSVFYPSRSILKPQLLINGAEAAANLILPVKRRCTHMGCALHYNKAERSWDCACHGSRFNENGEVIDNPATRRRKRDASPNAEQV